MTDDWYYLYANVFQLIAREVQEEGLARVRILKILTSSYLVFWCPLFLITLLSWSWSWEEAKHSTAHIVSIVCFPPIPDNLARGDNSYLLQSRHRPPPTPAVPPARPKEVTPGPGIL